MEKRKTKVVMGQEIEACSDCYFIISNKEERTKRRCLFCIFLLELIESGQFVKIEPVR